MIEKRAIALAALASVIGCVPLRAEASSTATGPLFEDISSETGLAFTHFNGMVGKFYFPEMTGQGGVPTMSFNGEPFFGQDRFNQFFWTLRQNGLTMRKRPRDPIVARPLRWPLASGLE